MTAGLHTFVGAYALNALTADEHEQFDQHLEVCAGCRAELLELQATAARLSDATWQPPPPAMKQRLLDAVRRLPQDRLRSSGSRGTSWRRLTPTLLVAAAVIAVVASLGAFLVERSRVSDLQHNQTTVATVLSAPDAQERTAKLPNGGSVRVISSAALDDAVVVLSDLPPLDVQHSYQLWRIGRGGPVSETVLPASKPQGSVTHLVDHLGTTERIALTVEPAGGSVRPTTKPVVTLAVA